MSDLMEIPEFCTRATPRVTRKRKTAEDDDDPDYNPITERVGTRAGKAANAKARVSSGRDHTAVSSSFLDSDGSSASGDDDDDDGLLIPMGIPLSRKKAWEERKVVRRSKVLSAERKKATPKLQYVDREQYSIENWKDKAEESKKEREEILKRSAVGSTKKKTAPPRVSFASEGNSEDESSDEEDDGYENEDIDYNLLASIAGDVDPMVQFLESRGIDSENFDLNNLPFFVMGTGKGKPGGPPAYEFNSLWNYELDPLSADDPSEVITANHCPWNKHDPTVPDFQPQVLTVVAVYSLGRRLDLKQIASNSRNVEYNPCRFAPLVMRVREPKTTALIFATGRVVVTGGKSVEETKRASRKFARNIQRLGYNVKVLGFTIQNISASCNFQFRVRLQVLAKNKLYGDLCYEPELFPGLIISLGYPRVKVIIFCTGSVLMTGARSMEELEEATKAMYPLCKMYGH